MSDLKPGPDQANIPPLKLKTSDRLSNTAPHGDNHELRDALRRANEGAEETLSREREFFKLRDEIAQKTRRVEDLTAQSSRLDTELRRQQGELRAWRYGAGALSVIGVAGAWVLMRRQRVSAPVADSSVRDSNFMRDSEDADPGSLSVADLAGPADPFDQGANRFDVASLYEAPLDLDADLLRDSRPPLDALPPAAAQAQPRTRPDSDDVTSAIASTAPASEPPAAELSSVKSLRKKVFGAAVEPNDSASTVLTNSSRASNASTTSAAASTSSSGQLPDLRWVPQPMQELLALNRALAEWRSTRQWQVAEQALLHHIRTYPDTSAWVYMELFQLYRSMDKRHEFEEWSMRYRTQFNRLAPTWQESAMEGKSLMRYDLALSQLTQAWAQGRTMWLLEQWLVGEAFMRRLMDPGACREVLFLYELCLSLGEMVRDAKGGVSTPKKF